MAASLLQYALERDNADLDRYELVSGFYGPGAVICWHFTHFSCLISWIMHLKKRKSDSIDVDFIAVLMYGVIASGHLLLQARAMPALDAQDPLLFTRAFHSLEASMSVTVVSAAVNIFPGFQLGFMRVIVNAAPVRTVVRRQVLRLLAFIWNLYCLYYLRATVPAICDGSPKNCWSLWDGTWIATPLLYSAVGVAWSYGYFQWIHVSPRQMDLPYLPEYTSPWVQRYLRLQLYRAPRIVFITLSILIGILTWAPTLSAGPNGFRWKSRPALLVLPFQQSESSLWDLDQAAAAVAGATTLGFSAFGMLRERVRAIRNRTYQEFMEDAILDEILGAGSTIEHAPAKQ